MAYSSFFGRKTVPQQIDPWAIPDGGDMLGPVDDGSEGGSGYGGYGDVGFSEQQLPPPSSGGDATVGQGIDESTGLPPVTGEKLPDAGSGTTHGWNGVIPPEGAWLTDTTPPPAGGAATSAPATGVNAPVNGGPSIQQAYSSALQKILTGGNVQQPGSSDAMVAYRNEAQRGEARDRAFLAERAAATGSSASGGFESDILGLRQNRRRGEAQFRGQEQQQLREAERQQLMQALALALSQGDNEAARALQQQLTMRGQDFSREAALNSNYTANRNTDLGFSNLGYNYQALQNQMNEQAYRYLFGE